MKRSNISGWKDVYTFTLVQTFKNKAFIVCFVILLILGIVSMPLISILTSDTNEIDGKSPIEKVYIINDTTMEMVDFSPVKNTESLSHISFETVDVDYEELQKQIDEEETSSVVLKITEDLGAYTLDFVRSSKGDVKDSSLRQLGQKVAECFDVAKLQFYGVTQEQARIVSMTTAKRVYHADADGVEVKKEDTRISQSDYWFVYGLLFVVLMINVMASSQVATSIVTDKSTRVIEVLLTSVRPLSIIVGKVLAMLTAVLAQISSFLIVAGISGICNKGIMESIMGDSATVTDTKTLLSNYINPSILSNIKVGNIILCIFVVALGMIFYATLAGLAGATVSKLEEVSEGLALFSMINMVGAYLGMGAASVLTGAGENAFVYFTLIFPLSAPFILPGAILLGKTNALIILGAILCQIIFIVLLAKFVANVYETLILHTGNRIRLKDLFGINKARKQQTANLVKKGGE